jgi:hypothetical protein
MSEDMKSIGMIIDDIYERYGTDLGRYFRDAIQEVGVKAVAKRAIPLSDTECRRCGGRVPYGRVTTLAGEYSTILCLSCDNEWSMEYHGKIQEVKERDIWQVSQQLLLARVAGGHASVDNLEETEDRLIEFRAREHGLTRALHERARAWVEAGMREEGGKDSNKGGT